MRLVWLGVLATMLASCVSAQRAHWVKLCDEDATRYQLGALHATSVERMCVKNQKIPKLITAPGTWEPMVKDAYYEAGGMVWISPAREDYAERTAGLRGVVFPHDTLAACVSAGDCQMQLARLAP